MFDSQGRKLLRVEIVILRPIWIYLFDEESLLQISEIWYIFIFLIHLFLYKFEVFHATNNYIKSDSWTKHLMSLSNTYFSISSNKDLRYISLKALVRNR